MNKTFKKLSLILIALALLPIFNVSAYTPKQLSPYVKEISERQEWQLEGDVELFKQQLSSIHNGEMTEPVWNNHTIQWLSVGKNSEVKTVVWTVSEPGTTDKWDATTLKAHIEDYEKTHPGYIVIGATNGDFFDNSSYGTGEPTNFHVQEGDVLRTAWNGQYIRGVVGFGATNKDYVGVYQPQHKEKMSLEVLENKNTIAEYTVEGTNQAPVETGVTVYNKNFSGSVDLAGYNVYEGTYNLYRDYSGGYFIKGTINGKTSLTTLNSVERGKFYIASKEDILTSGAAVKVEYNLAGELEGINEVVGFNYQVLKDGKPQLAGESEAHVKTNHPRTLVGFKKDGSVVLMVIDGRGSVAENLEGASLFQCGELLRLAGCVEGYNLDGGGSSTLMARINGQMTLINDPSDARQTGQPWGSLRGTGNAVLLVMRDPRLQIEEAKGNTITVSKAGEVINGTLQNVKVKVGTKEYEMTGDKVTVTGLKTNTEYAVSYTYEVLNDDGTIDKGASSTYTIKTEDYSLPVLDAFEEDSKENGTLKLEYEVKDPDKKVKTLYIQNGSSKTTLSDLSGKVVIENIDTKVKNTFVLMAELENGEVIELSELIYEAGSIPAKEETPNPDEKPNPDDNPSDPDETKPGGCKKDLGYVVISLISLATVLVVFKKRR